jgi:hypothetical protein
MNRWLYRLIQAAVSIAVIICLSLIYAHFKILADQSGKSWALQVSEFCIDVVFGLLLGMEHLLKELSIKGKWSFNLPRILFMGIPSLVLGLYAFIYYSGVPIITTITNNLPGFLGQSPIGWAFAQILFGYILITNFTKAAQPQAG